MQEYNHKHVRTWSGVCTPSHAHTRIRSTSYFATHNHTWWVLMQHYHTKTTTIYINFMPANKPCTVEICHSVHSIPHLSDCSHTIYLLHGAAIYIQASTTLDTNKKYISDKVTATLLYLLKGERHFTHMVIYSESSYPATLPRGGDWSGVSGIYTSTCIRYSPHI